MPPRDGKITTYAVFGNQAGRFLRERCPNARGALPRVLVLDQAPGRADRGRPEATDRVRVVRGHVLLAGDPRDLLAVQGQPRVPGEMGADRNFEATAIRTRCGGAVDGEEVVEEEAREEIALRRVDLRLVAGGIRVGQHRTRPARGRIVRVVLDL